jgi:stage III sporulation protein SpoIIIAA
VDEHGRNPDSKDLDQLQQQQEELIKLIQLLPPHFQEHVFAHGEWESMIEVVMDLGRELEVRYPDNYFSLYPRCVVTETDLMYTVSRLTEFGPDDRTGVDGTLHRISRILSRSGAVLGLTFRAGRDHPTSHVLIKEFISTQESTLILGPPSSGKTTMLRSIAHHFSVNEQKRVVIVDTSNEIGVEGDIPHPAIGRARRMQVPRGRSQAEIMISAVENHNPNVLIVDEISTYEEAIAARSIAQRGVQLIATAHGRQLTDLMRNPPLCNLVGGIDRVTLSDETARQRGLTNKTILEREQAPTFDRLIELRSFDELATYTCVTNAVDALLKEGVCEPGIYRLIDGVRIVQLQKEAISVPTAIDANPHRVQVHSDPVQQTSVREQVREREREVRNSSRSSSPIAERQMNRSKRRR